MMCCGSKTGRKHRAWKVIFIPIAIAALFLFGWVVMHLWNSILPGVIGVATITFWQAVGILVLSKILFGGFKGCHGHSGFHHNHRYELHEKWMQMSPEEREKMKAEMKERCKPWAKQE